MKNHISRILIIVFIAVSVILTLIFVKVAREFFHFNKHGEKKTAKVKSFYNHSGTRVYQFEFLNAKNEVVESRYDNGSIDYKIGAEVEIIADSPNLLSVISDFK